MENEVKKMKVSSVTIIGIVVFLLSSVATGLGVYVWRESVNNETQSDLNAKIDRLESDLNSLKTENGEATSVEIDNGLNSELNEDHSVNSELNEDHSVNKDKNTKGLSEDWLIYNNEDFGVSFKYPNVGWALDVISDDLVTNTLYLTVTNSSDIKFVFHYNGGGPEICSGAANEYREVNSLTQKYRVPKTGTRYNSIYTYSVCRRQGSDIDASWEDWMNPGWIEYQAPTSKIPANTSDILDEMLSTYNSL